MSKVLKAAYQTIIVGKLLKHGKQIIISGKDYVHNPENKLTLTMWARLPNLSGPRSTSARRAGDSTGCAWAR
jgi:hypothetical protein